MKLNPYLEVIFAAAIWGSSGVFIKYLNLPATTMSFFRVIVPTLIITVYFLIKKKKLFKGDNKLMLFASLLNAIRMFLYFVAYIYTSIGNAVIMLYTWPIFAAIFGFFILKEKITKRGIFLMMLAFAGIVFVYLNKEFSFADNDFIGMTAMLISAFVYSLSFIIFKKESEKYSKWETIFYQNLVGCFLFLPFLFINKPLPNLNQVSVVTVYALLIGMVGFGLFFSALKKIKASTASSLSYFEVVSAILFGIIFFKEVLTWNVVVGGLMIVVSTILMRK